MIEVHYNGKDYDFSDNTIASKLKEALGCKDCIGFYDKDNDIVYDLQSQIQGPVCLEVISLKSKHADKILRATLGLVLASCIDGQLLDIQLLENGFACKFFTHNAISQNDFSIIEQDMLVLIKQGGEVDKEILSYEESLDQKKEDNFDLDLWPLDENGPNCWYTLNNKRVFSELKFLNNIKNAPQYFKLQKVAQEDYIVNDEKVKVQKITVAAFSDAESLKAYLDRMELLKQNDHRVIGQAMDLFYTIPEAAGSVFWLANGWKLVKALEAFIRKISYSEFHEVKTPLVMSSVFWEKSGHMAAYGKNMMHINMGQEEQESAALKPMNCPAHIEVFKHKLRSYRNLPYRIAELGSCHRYEPSGALNGLFRVRAFTMDDGHIFCTREQIQSEVEKFMSRALEMYEYFGFDEVSIKLSTRPEGFLGEIENWDYAEKVLEEAIKALDIDYEIAEGEGAFYGPKIELHVRDSLDRSWQLGTIQLDFVLPERFDISYTDENGEKQQPCMLHRAMLGSIERFIAVLLEHTGGHLPIEIAPLQIAVCSITSECAEYAKKVSDILEESGIRVELDIRDQTLSAKIKQHKIAKVPALCVIGKDEMNNNKVTIEYKQEKFVLNLDELKIKIKDILK